MDLAIVGLKGRIKVMAEQLSKMRMGADSKALEAQLVRVQGQLLGVARQAASLTMEGDTKKLDAQIAREKASLRKLQQQMSDLQVDADVSAAEAKIARLELAESRLEKRLKTMKGVLNIADAEAKLASIRDQLAVLGSNELAVKLHADNKAALAQIKAVKASITQLREEAARIKLNVDPGALMGVEATLLGIEATIEGLGKKAIPVADTALGALSKAINGNGTGWGFLTRDITLFGGIFNKVLPVVLSSVKVWHVLSDAIIEIGAVWIPATVAVGAFAVAASDTAVEVQRRMQAMHTELDATGRSIPLLTSGMEQLHKAVRPAALQLFGDAILIMKHNTGTFATVAKGTGTVIDQLGARLTAAVTSGKGMNNFMSQAVTDASKLGDSIGNVFGIFGNLFKALPGFAAGLLTIGDDFTKILETASAALVPVLKWILLLHGYILYTGLAVTAGLAFIGGIANLAKLFVTFAADSVMAGVGAIKAFALSMWAGITAIIEYGAATIALAGEEGILVAALTVLQDVPIVVWFALAAAAIAGLIYLFRSGSSATKDFTDGLQKTIAAASLSQVIPTILGAQAQVTQQLTSAQAKLADTTKYQGAVNFKTGQVTQQLTQAYRDQQGVIDALKGAQGTLGDQYRLVSGRVGGLAKTYGGTTQALGALNLAGITTAQILDKNKSHWAQALIQVQATTDAFKVMGIQGGQLGNDLDVLGRTVTDQYQSVQKLNQAWSSFISDVTGTQGAFDTVAQGFFTLADHSSKLHFSLGKLKVAYADANVAIDSLTPAGIALNQAFGDQVTNVDKLFGSWRTAGLANNLFNQGVKDAIAPLVKYANGSQEATAQLVALAQEAGYQGPISMQALTKWLGNTHGATKNLKDITDQATIQEALLTGAMQDQGNFISSKLLGDINNAILAYSGVESAVTAYGTAVAQSGKNSDLARGKMVKAITAIVTAELAMGDNTSQMAAIVAKTFGISIPAAMSLVDQSLGNLADKALPGTQKAFVTFAEIGLHKTAGKAHDLWGEVVAKLGPALNALGDLAGGKAKNKFIDWAENGLHLSKDQATFLWQEVVKLQGHIDDLHGKNVTVGVNFVGSGTGSIAFKESIPGVTTGPSSSGILGFHAAGGRIPGFAPGVDNHLAMLSGGEFVLAPETASALGYDNLERINRNHVARRTGFAAGGTVGGVMTHATGAGGLMQSGQSFMQKAEANFGQAVENAFARAVIAKFNKDMNSLGGSGSAIVSYARSFLGKIPYVFGGNSLSSGIDCSGFTQAVYGKFGIHAPRTSEAQYAWATKSAAVPGSLAFYVSPAGGSPPGHVAIVQDRTSVISQGGGMGPTIQSLGFLPLMGTGVPKGGLPSAGGGSGNKAILGHSGRFSEAQLEQLWIQAQGRAGAAISMGAIAIAESGGDPNARNPSGASGLWQILGNPFPGNPFDPLTNARMAVSKYNANGFFPWISDPVAADLIRQGITRSKGGLIPRFAAGGSLGAKLAVAQAGERAKYSGLEHAFAAGPAKYRTASTLSELHTLTTRQGAELSAYAALFQGGASQSELAHLGATARAVSKTAADKALNRLPGGHPGWGADLRSYAGQLSALSTSKIPASGLGSGSAPAPHPAGAPSGNVALQGAAWLKAWQTRHGGGFGAAWGPVVVNQQIAAMMAAEAKAATLSRASGLTAAQHRHYASVATDEGKRLAVLNRELSVERSYRGQLGASDTTLTADINAARGVPALAGNTRSWQAQITRQKGTIAAISKMLGYSDATIAAQIAAAEKAGTLGPGGTPLPVITHTYGGDVANTIGAFLHSVIAPFARGGTAPFARGGMTSFDNGGMLQPGATLAWNGTGKPEPVGAQPVHVHFEVGSSGNHEFDSFMLRWIRRNVHVKGAGDVQRAFGEHGKGN